MNENDFASWAEKQKKDSGLSFDLHLISRGYNQSNQSPPAIFINKKMLTKPDEIKGVFLHELGHIAHPVEDTYKLKFTLAKILGFGQILLFPYFFKVAKFAHFNFGFNYLVSCLIILYIVKFLCNTYFLDVSKRIKKAEYLADAYSYLNDPDHQQIVSYKDQTVKLSLLDIFIRITPVFILITHPTVLERIEALEKKTYFHELKKVK